MTNSSSEFLAEQKRLAEAATEGPWHVDDYGGVSEALGPVIDTEGCGMGNPADADFIAAARNGYPKLIAALEAVEVLIAKHRSIEQHNEQVPIHDIGALIREPSSAEYLAVIEAALGGDDDE